MRISGISCNVSYKSAPKAKPQNGACAVDKYDNEYNKKALLWGDIAEKMIAGDETLFEAEGADDVSEYEKYPFEN